MENSKEHKNSEKEDIGNLADITENAYEYAKLAYEQEEKRENSIISQATQMTTYFSFVSVLVLMIVPVITVAETMIPIMYTAIVTVTDLMILFVSMILAVMVQWRYKYKSLPSPMASFVHLMNNREFFQTVEQRNKSFVQSLEETWSSKRKANDKRVKMLCASMILFMIAIAFLLCATLFGIVAFVLI